MNVNYTNQVRKGILIIGFNQPLSDALVQDLIKAYPQYELKQSTQPDSSELVTFTTNAKDTYDTFKQRCYLKQHPTIMLVDFDYISLPW